MPARRMVVVLVAATTAMLTGCTAAPPSDESTDGRPSPQAWTATWDATTAIVPDLDELGAPANTEVCEDTVGALRTARADVYPTPDELVDEQVDRWLLQATNMFFECFESGVGADPPAQGYEELRRLQDEVDAALASLP